MEEQEQIVEVKKNLLMRDEVLKVSDVSGADFGLSLEEMFSQGIIVFSADSGIWF